MSSKSFQIRISSDPAELADTRKAIEAFCTTAGLDQAACNDVGLCVNEALANVIRHAYAGATGQAIMISAIQQAMGIKISIRDWGSGVNPELLPTKNKDPSQPGGLGLLCLRKMMDEVTYTPQSDGMLLEMTKRNL